MVAAEQEAREQDNTLALKHLGAVAERLAKLRGEGATLPPLDASLPPATLLARVEEAVASKSRLLYLMDVVAEVVAAVDPRRWGSSWWRLTVGNEC